MKLRNKKTGEIRELPDGFFCGDNLKKICEEWEDYEEPKPQVVYYIDRDGEIVPYRNIEYPKRVFNTEQNKEIGNYFLSREEAEKAARKLKAWKRLKDKGFKLKGWYMPKNVLNIEIDGGFSDDVSLCDIMDDLDKVFGGEE